MKKAVSTMLLHGASLSLLVAASAMSSISAAGAAELRVTGKIVPDACLPVFSDAGVVDYGPISSERGAAKILSKKIFTLSVSCTLPSRLALRLIDNRDSAPIPQMQAVTLRNRSKKDLFGLGAQSGQNAGAYIVSFEPAHPTATPPTMMESATGINATQWMLSSDNTLRKNVLYAWDAEHKIHPGGTLNFEARLSIQAVIDSTDNTATKEDASLNGSATFELLYL
jgi:type 1 fimbria pilin